MGQFLLLPTKMLLLLSCLTATAFASPLQFERVPSLDNRIPLLVQDRVPNPCLTKANDTCIFPFTYNGVEYYRCTYADSPTPWCATMVDPNNTVVTNRWGDCSTSQFSNCPEDTPDIASCTAESGAACVFPFRHLGITYSSCASTDLLSSAWCSTSTHENGTHILGSVSALPLALVPRLQPQPPQPLQQQQLLLPPPPQCPPQPPQPPPPPPRPPQLQQT